MITKLTATELNQISQCAKKRNIQHRTSRSTNVFIPEQNVIGIAGEYGLSKIMKVPYCWIQSHDRSSVADFYFYYSEYPQPIKVDIKTVTHPNKSLMIAKFIYPNGTRKIKPFYPFYILMYFDRSLNKIEYKGFATFQDVLLFSSLEPGLNDKPFYKLNQSQLNLYPIWEHERFSKIEHR